MVTQKLNLSLWKIQVQKKRQLLSWLRKALQLLQEITHWKAMKTLKGRSIFAVAQNPKAIPFVMAHTGQIRNNCIHRSV